MKYDFGGYATKSGLKCSDGRMIMRDAFKDQDGTTVPLVWQHFHDEPQNVLGHAVLENRADGVYCYGVINDATPNGANAKALVQHGDIDSLSIYANQLQERGNNVIHGAIREVSLVLAGANPGAKIDNLAFEHGDGEYTNDETEAVIFTGLTLAHADDMTKKDPTPAPTASLDNKDPANSDDSSGKTVKEIFDTLTDEQKNVVYALIAQALSGGTDSEDSSDTTDTTGTDDMSQSAVTAQNFANMFDALDAQQQAIVYSAISGVNNTTYGGNTMKHNVFDQTQNLQNKHFLSHDQMGEILGDAKRYGSLKESFIAHAETYGFNPTEVMFPDAVATNQNGPELVKRPDDWVNIVLNSAKHTPFSRIKTITADVTADAARAKGYVTGNLKKDEIITLLKRTTTPATIYKKQKMDRDDIVDITDFDVIAWLKNEMRAMLNEELARAILIGDGRSVADEDKVNEQNIRPIALDDDSVYVVRSQLENDAGTDDIIDEIIRSRKDYRGTGIPTLFTSTTLLTDMLLVKDSMGRRLYNNVEELASVLRVSQIVEVELMNGATRKVSDTQTNDILGVVVNMADYTIGADKGGEVNMFDDFDIDYNQQKYLIETRCSGALTKPKSAIVIERKPAAV